jgi:FkbM family methyltransferase
MQRVYARDFELFGYGPDPTDTKPIARVDAAAVNAAVRNEQAAFTHVPSATIEPKEDPIELNGVTLLVEKEFLSPRMLQVLTTGDYEREEARRIPKVIKPGERIVELGGGIGYISAICGRNKHVDTITVFEAHPDLVPMIERTHEINGVRSRVINAVVLPKADRATAPFYLRADFWASSLNPKPYGYERVVDVPVMPLSKMLEDFQPTMLIVDIEGGEGMLFNDIELPGVRKVYLEVHPDVLDVAEVKRIFDFFAARRFVYDDWNSTGNGVLFKQVFGRAMNPQRLWNKYLRRWLKKVTPPAARHAARKLVGSATIKQRMQQEADAAETPRT